MPVTHIAACCLALFVATAGHSQERLAPPLHIEMETSQGRILIELDAEAAPLTVRHILSLVDARFFDGLIFHRVIAGFMIQGGGFTPGYDQREDERTIPNESGNGLSNLRGTIAMARTNQPHSANSQFFINVTDNPRLDPVKAPGGGRWGYTVFGIVIEGMDIVDKIAAVPTGRTNGMQDVPQTPVIIDSVARFTFE